MALSNIFREPRIEVVTDAVMNHRFASGETLEGVLYDSWYFGTNYDAAKERAHIRELCRGIAATALRAASSGTDEQVEVVRQRLADGRTIADADVHSLVAEIDRLRAIIRGGSA